MIDQHPLPPSDLPSRREMLMYPFLQSIIEYHVIQKLTPSFLADSPESKVKIPRNMTKTFIANLFHSNVAILMEKKISVKQLHMVVKP